MDTTVRRGASSQPPSGRSTPLGFSTRCWEEETALYLEKPLPDVPARNTHSARGRSARPRSPAPVPPLRITRKAVGSPSARYESQSPVRPPQLPRKSSRRKDRSSMVQPQQQHQQRQQFGAYSEWRPSPDRSSTLSSNLNPHVTVHGPAKHSKKIAQLLGHDVDVNDGSFRGVREQQRTYKPGHSRQTSDASITSTVPSLARSVDSMHPPPLEPSCTGHSSRDTSWGSSPSRRPMRDQVPHIAFESADGLPSESPSADEIMLAGEYHQFAAELANLDRTSLDDNALHLPMPTTKPVRPPRPADLETPQVAARPSTARETGPTWSPFPPPQQEQQQRPRAVPVNPVMQSVFDDDSDDDGDGDSDIKDRALKAIFGRKDGKSADRLSVDRKARASVVDYNAGNGKDKDAKGRWDSALGKVRVWQAFKDGREK